MDWLRTPIGLVRQWAARLPQLRAQEALASVEQIGLGMGLYDKDTAHRTLTALREAAGAGACVKAQKLPKSMRGALGFGVRTALPERG